MKGNSSFGFIEVIIYHNNIPGISCDSEPGYVSVLYIGLLTAIHLVSTAIFQFVIIINYALFNDFEMTTGVG